MTRRAPPPQSGPAADSLRLRFLGAALLAALAPFAALMAALVALDAPASLALSLSALALVGALTGALMARRAAKPVERLAARVDARVWGGDPPEGRHALGRLEHGVSLLLERLEEREIAASPARLDDPLTGLANRVGLMRGGRDEIARARRSGAPLSLALIEIADFESYAAEQGPLAAEIALRRAAEAIAPALRAYDSLGRWDATSFAALLPDAEIEYAMAALRRIRAAVEGARIGEREGAPLSIVAGVGVLHPEDATLAEIAQRAGRALSRARRGQGDGVEAAPGHRTKPARLSPV